MFWIELKCDSRLPGCVSDGSAYPMCMSGTNRPQITAAIKWLEREGRTAGWVRTRDGWMCPRCKDAITGKRNASNASR